MRPTKELLAVSRERIYRAFRQKNPELFFKAINAAEAVTLSFNLPNKVAVEIEAAVVQSVFDALGLEIIEPVADPEDRSIGMTAKLDEGRQ